MSAKPNKKWIGDEQHRLLLGRVETKDSLGRPLVVTLLWNENQQIKMETGLEFITIYIPEVNGHLENQN